jgi:hypothetical protein
MHEVGHNINLAHSGEGTAEYADQTGMMGYSYSEDEGPAMCFNNAKMWQLGWCVVPTPRADSDVVANFAFSLRSLRRVQVVSYFELALLQRNRHTWAPNATFTLTLTFVVTNTINLRYADKVLQWSGTSTTVELVGLSDYSSAGTGQQIVFKIPGSLSSMQSVNDFYIGFNRKTGINSGTKEGGNQVTIQTKPAGNNAYVTPCGIQLMSPLHQSSVNGGVFSSSSRLFVIADCPFGTSQTVRLCSCPLMECCILSSAALNPTRLPSPPLQTHSNSMSLLRSQPYAY